MHTVSSMFRGDALPAPGLIYFGGENIFTALCFRVALVLLSLSLGVLGACVAIITCICVPALPGIFYQGGLLFFVYCLSMAMRQ